MVWVASLRELCSNARDREYQVAAGDGNTAVSYDANPDGPMLSRLAVDDFAPLSATCPIGLSAAP